MDGIETRTYFYPLTSEHNYICKERLNPFIQTPRAKSVSEKVLTLPLSGNLEPENVYNICDRILSV